MRRFGNGQVLQIHPLEVHQARIGDLGAVEPENHTRPSNSKSAKRVKRNNNPNSFSAAYGHHKYGNTNTVTQIRLHKYGNTNTKTTTLINKRKHHEMTANRAIRFSGSRIGGPLSSPHSRRDFLVSSCWRLSESTHFRAHPPDGEQDNYAVNRKCEIRIDH